MRAATAPARRESTASRTTTGSSSRSSGLLQLQERLELFDEQCGLVRPRPADFHGNWKPMFPVRAFAGLSFRSSTELLGTVTAEGTRFVQASCAKPRWFAATNSVICRFMKSGRSQTVSRFSRLPRLTGTNWARHSSGAAAGELDRTRVARPARRPLLVRSSLGVVPRCPHSQTEVPIQRVAQVRHVPMPLLWAILSRSKHNRTMRSAESAAGLLFSMTVPEFMKR